MKMLIPIAVLGLAACGSGADEATRVSVTTTTNTCDVTPDTVEAGNVVFSVQNTGSATTSFSIVGSGGAAVGALEDLGPAVARDLVVSLEPGSYTAVCGAGQDAVQRAFTVTQS